MYIDKSNGKLYSNLIIKFEPKYKLMILEFELCNIASNKNKIKVWKSTNKFIKMAIMLSICPNNVNVLVQYISGFHSHLWRQVMLLKPRIIDEKCVSTILGEYMNKPPNIL